MPDRDNWTAAMVLRWVLTGDQAAVLAMVDTSIGVFADHTVSRLAREDIDTVTIVYCIDPTIPPGELKNAMAVVRSQRVIAAKDEIYRALRRGDLEARARRNGTGDVEKITPEQWLSLKFQSRNGHDLAVPIDVEQNTLHPRPLADYLTGGVPIDTRPVVWPDPHMPAAQVEKLWLAGGATRFTASAEAETESWLISLMKSGNPIQAKRQYEAEARKSFRVGTRAFNRAWRVAVRATTNTRWSRPGRKSQHCIDTPAKS